MSEIVVEQRSQQPDHAGLVLVGTLVDIVLTYLVLTVIETMPSGGQRS